MFSIALTMRLKPGTLEIYRQAHNNLWPEIARSMSDNRVSMAIFHQEGRLFLFACAPDRESWDRSRLHPALARWDAEMTRCLEEESPGRIAFQQPSKVFGFGEFKED